MRPRFALAALALICLLVQLAAFRLIDPLGYPDTIRYFALADFLAHPTDTHEGDLADSRGLLFTPLFLPVFLLTAKKALGLPYEVSGTLLQCVSLQAILWACYAIARRMAGQRAAAFTLVLLSANLCFFLRSCFILTEYAFAAVLLLTFLYVQRRECMGLKETAILGLLLGLLCSIRTNGAVFALLMAFHVVRSGKVRMPRLALPAVALPLLCLVLHHLLLLWFEARFPGALASNTSFSVSSFLLGDRFADYDYTVHGPRALADTQSLLDFVGAHPLEYARLLLTRCREHAVMLFTTAHGGYGLFVAGLLVAVVQSRGGTPDKGVLCGWIGANLAVALLALTPSYAVTRYQAGSFPFAVILIAVAAARGPSGGNGIAASREWTAGPMACTLGLLYAGYSLLLLSGFASYWGFGRYVHWRFPRQAAVASASALRERMGDERQRVATTDTLRYGVIYRAGMTPVYLNPHWGREAVRDYTTTRAIGYFLANRSDLDALAAGTNRIEIVSPLLETRQAEYKTLLCRFVYNE